MSIKSVLLFTSFLVVLSTPVWADYSSTSGEDDIEAAQSMKAMRPLLDLDQAKIPLSEFEAESPMSGVMRNYIVMTQEALDKEEIPGLKGTSFMLTELENEIITTQLSKRVQFSPSEGSEEESWIQTVGKILEKSVPHSFEYGFEMPD